jgi:hypothetical protein
MTDRFFLVPKLLVVSHEVPVGRLAGIGKSASMRMAL